MEMANTQTLFCRMDYQNGSVWRNEQDEAGRSCGKIAEAERLENGRFTNLSIEACQDEAVLASETRM